MKAIMAGMLAGVLTSGSFGADWAQWRGPAANGISTETGWSAKAAKKAWSKELGEGYSAVAVKDGALYTMGNIDGKDIVYALDAASGTERWTYSYACQPGQYKGPRATPVMDGDALYTISREGLVICFDAAAGTVRWQADVLDKTGIENIKWGVSSSAVVEGGLLLFNIGGAGVALEKATGKVVWKSKGQHSYATPVVFDHKGKRLAAIFSAPGLQLVEAATGNRIAEYKWETKYDINGADPLLIGEKIFISSGYDHGCALLDFSSGRLEAVWENDLLKNQFSSSIYVDGFIYGVDGQTRKKGHLRCLSAEDGSEKWSMPIGFGSLISADGRLIALGESGTLYFAEVNSSAYKEIHQMDTGLGNLCWTPPVLANGFIYCRNDKGTLVAIDVRK